MTHILKCFLLILGLLVHKSVEKLHDGFATCKVKESNFESCLSSAIENGIKLFKNGLPDYNMPPLDPFHIDSFTVEAGSGPVNLAQNYENAVFTGFVDIRVNNSRIDFGKKILTYSSMSPLLVQKSHYQINGKILMLPVHGSGSCSLTLENAFSDHTIHFEEVEKQGDIYFIPKSYILKLQPARARYHFDNLFDGNKLLGDNINNLINEEWDAIFRDVQDGYEKALTKYFLQYAKAVFEKTPIKEIFIQ